MGTTNLEARHITGTKGYQVPNTTFEYLIAPQQGVGTYKISVQRVLRKTGTMIEESAFSPTKTIIIPKE